jgi:tRNA modification GTPase
MNPERGFFYMFEAKSDTIISLISSSSGGSVSVIRLSGPKTFELVNKFFVTESKREKKGGTFFFGKIFEPDGNIIDEVIASFFQAPHSYTGEDIVELSCHANPFIVKDILSIFTKSGCRLAEPGEFTKRAFLNGKMDLVQAEAVAELISSKSKAGVKNSLMQIEGNLSKKLLEIKQSLLDLSSLMELDLDFSEDDLEIIESSTIEKKLESVVLAINTLLDSYQYGHILNRGIEVLITGKPNVGKSSLMNRLINKDRVIVSEIPGTTRDMIHEDIVIDNILIRFIDSAGIRFTENSIEIEGVRRARDYMEQADFIILLTDISEENNSSDIELIAHTEKNYREKMIICGNKVDKGVYNNLAELFNKKQIDIHYISALNGTGIEEIKKILVKKVHDVKEHLSEEILISSERQYQILKMCKSSVEEAIKNIKKNIGYEFIAVDLRQANQYISEITGEISTDDILNNIFSKFCIGK